MTVLGAVDNTLVESSATVTEEDESLKKETTAEEEAQDVNEQETMEECTPADDVRTDTEASAEDDETPQEEAENNGANEESTEKETGPVEDDHDNKQDKKDKKKINPDDDDDDDYNYEGRYNRRIREDVDQAWVQTPYGRGLVIRTRKHPTTHKIVSRDIELRDWKTTTPKKGRPPQPTMLYASQQFPSVEAQVGDQVTCQFGRGKVVAIDNNATPTKRIQVELTSWRLARRSTVKCFLSADAVQVVRDKLVYEMNVYERVAHAQELKEAARQAFVQKDYERALTKYALAVDAVRYVQHDKTSTNELRADLLVVMITACNNAATCCAQSSPKQWDQVAKYAQNALVLMQALEDRQNDKQKQSNIMKILIQDGIDATKIFGEWKGKSLVFLAKTEYQGKQNFTKAMEYCKTAHDTVTKYTKQSPQNKVLLQQAKEIARIHAAAKEGKQKEKKKEKQRAQAMFGGKSPERKVQEAKTTNSPTTTATKELEEATNDKTKSEAASDDNDNNGFPKIKRTVTFEDGGKPSDAYEKKSPKAEADDNDDGDGEEEAELPWYQEHQELIILVGGVVLLVLGWQTLLRNRGSPKRSRT